MFFNTTFESMQARKINAIMWQAVPNIDNTLCEKCGPCSTAGMWFQYFIWMSTCDTGDPKLQTITILKVTPTTTIPASAAYDHS